MLFFLKEYNKQMGMDSYKKPVDNPQQFKVEFPKDPVLLAFAKKYGVPYEDLTLTANNIIKVRGEDSINWYPKYLAGLEQNKNNSLKKNIN